MKPQASPVPPLNFSRYLVDVKKRLTRRGKFLCEMERVLPWGKLLALHSPRYPAGGKVGRPPTGLERMYLLQQWFALADEAVEDALHDSRSMCEFAGIDLSCQSVPDSTTLLQFRRRLERHGLTQQLFECINAHLREHNLLLHEGTLIDATLVAAPSSTKNRAHARDGEMHQTKKGNQWYFGLKAHTGVDAASGLVHGLHVTSANESDVAHAHALLHGAEVEVFADAGYGGVSMRRRFCRRKHRGGYARTSDGIWHSGAASS